jgi:3-hydroxyacyl-CoA dehydrogenase/enoyl-CoA hydratase/3-hydroxybutyryl-CoA epimerase
MPLERAQAIEAEVVGGLLASEICKNLIGVFRMTERARKRRPDAEPRPVERAAVVGAGVMGSAIAELFAYRAIPVRLKDIDWDRVLEGLREARRLLERGRGPAHERERRVESLLGTLDYEGFETADLVIEAVVEKMSVKKEVFRELEARVAPRAVLATNTSALSIGELQEGLRHPERVCGMHFFNPAHRMPLLEIVIGPQTDAETLATAFAAGALLGKTPILVEDRPGFLVNRVLAAYLTEAGHLLQQGLEPEALDETMVSFGMPMGPLRLLDEIGLDVAADVQVTLRTGLGERFTPAPVVALVMEAGRLGRKSGAGFYRYRNGRARGLHSKTGALLREARSAGSPPPLEDARDRMVLAMVNEAARALADGVVSHPEDVELGMILGTGFPPFRGGLLRYADGLGLPEVVARLRGFADAVGERFRPAPLLEELAGSGRGFHDGPRPDS